MELTDLNSIKVNDAEVICDSITLDFIKNRIEKDFDFDLTLRTRKRQDTYIRAIYYKLCREFTVYSLEQIANFIDRTHASVLNGINYTFKEAMFHEKYFKKYYKDLKAELEGLPTLEKRYKESLVRIKELEHTLDSYRDGTLR